MTYEFEAELWLWQQRTDSWTFVSLPTEVADEVLDAGEHVARGFGSLRVEVTLGSTTWRTSVFPDKGRGTFVLPVKRAVRTAEDLQAGDVARFRLALVDVTAPSSGRG